MSKIASSFFAMCARNSGVVCSSFPSCSWWQSFSLFQENEDSVILWDSLRHRSNLWKTSINHLPFRSFTLNRIISMYLVMPENAGKCSSRHPGHIIHMNYGFQHALKWFCWLGCWELKSTLLSGCPWKAVGEETPRRICFLRPGMGFASFQCSRSLISKWGLQEMIPNWSSSLLPSKSCLHQEQPYVSSELCSLPHPPFWRGLQQSNGWTFWFLPLESYHVRSQGFQPTLLSLPHPQRYVSLTCGG